MSISLFELFTIGIGPSSSHTVGPMRAAYTFVRRLEAENTLRRTSSIEVQLFGSLGATGKGHGSDKAVVAGLAGRTPETADPEDLQELLQLVSESRALPLLGKHEISFSLDEHLKFRRKTLEMHSNSMRFVAHDSNGKTLLQDTYCSVGGGFVVEADAANAETLITPGNELPYAFSSGNQLLELCQTHGLSISKLMLKNEQHWHTEAIICAKILELWEVMQACITRGCHQEGILPGGLKVKRRAAPLYRKLQNAQASQLPASNMDWVNLWALAVNEENAAGGRVVTAPTNGAAGIIPAVLMYHHHFCQGKPHEQEDADATVRFLLTAAAIGILFKLNASISGAEVGCQGEVGAACSMAAAGLAEILGGTPSQVENAAEIGMEHNLGLTCDPIGGLVQVPCIERNAMGAVKAINAARLALRGDGSHFVSLDKVIKTMRVTGADMKAKYKETARGGLAVNVTEC